MSATDDAPPPVGIADADGPAHRGGGIPWIYVLAVFCGASLVFMVQPMVAKLVLPTLGGTPAVWNTSMAFFQFALLAGYGYAHFLQKIPVVRTQVIVHLGVLLVAALLLPLRITNLFGDPNPGSPALWLIGVLFISIGAPFAALSATAPLVQAWHAKVHGRDGGPEPWALYAASNLGSLLALLAYPILVEPTLALADQRWGWTAGYGVFVVILGVLAWTLRKETTPQTVAVSGAAAEPISWRDRAVWVVLAALPSSLMLGVTTHLTTDVASAPFLWVAPLSLYLLTFIIAFQTRPMIHPRWALILMSAAIIVCLATTPFDPPNVLVILGVHLGTFFLAALVCHQALVARRPDPAHLTDFYLCMSLGGVIGGAFNAFVAPVVFNTAIEYTAVLALCALVRPRGDGKLSRFEIAALIIALIGAVAAMNAVTGWFWSWLSSQNVSPKDPVFYISSIGILSIAVAAVAVRERALPFFAVVVMLAITARVVDQRATAYENHRSFFGVVHLSTSDITALGGDVKIFTHGTTLHGAQAVDPTYRCRPLTYYAPETAIGQVFNQVQGQKAATRIAAVGLGSGAVATYARAGDHLTFFEIDPQVVAISSNPKYFSYTTECAKGTVDYVVGDARLTLAKQAPDQFDILLVDAFSSDAIPAHLLTVEAMKMYLSKMKPDGVIILHLSNRHLELIFPAASVVKAAGGYSMFQSYAQPDNTPYYWASSEDVMIVTKSKAAMQPYLLDTRWMASPPATVRPWTDDYTNLVGAMLAVFTKRRHLWQQQEPAQ